VIDEVCVGDCEGERACEADCDGDFVAVAVATCVGVTACMKSIKHNDNTTNMTINAIDLI
jgi:hypothetical protein